MGQRADESTEDWYRRTVVEFRNALVELTHHWQRLGLDKVIPRSRPYPLVDAAYECALYEARRLEDEMMSASRAQGRIRHASVLDLN